MVRHPATVGRPGRGGGARAVGMLRGAAGGRRRRRRRREALAVELCDRMATARCGLLSRCHAAWSRAPADSCHRLEQSRCLAEYGRLRPSLEAGAVEIDSEKVLSCEERMYAVAIPAAKPGGTRSCSGVNVYCKASQTVPDQGTCTGSAGLNERCASRLDSGQVIQIPCETGHCDTETTLNCLPASRGIGEPCGSDGECLSGRCAVQEDQSLRCAPSCL